MRLSAKKLSYSYPRGPEVLRQISFEAGEGELLGVLGPNGAGKSTLFRCVLGLLRDYTGEIRIDGEDIKRLSPAELAGRVAYLPQSHGRMAGYSVREVVLMGTARALSPFAAPGKREEALTQTALERLGIAGLAGRDFSRLSGGEQQLALIARALAQQARVLVMDEPTASLDYGNRFRVLELAEELAAEGYTVLLSTHDPQSVLTFAHRVLAISGGGVAAFGPTAEALTPELIQRLYRVETRFAPVAGQPIVVPVKGERQ